MPTAASARTLAMRQPAEAGANMPQYDVVWAGTEAKWGLGYEPKGEQEDWFTQGHFVTTPASYSAEALPKQPWDSYKPDFWAGIPIVLQQPLHNLPYFWEAPSETANYSYFTPVTQQVWGNAYQVRNFSAPVGGIYTGTTDPCQ